MYQNYLGIDIGKFEFVVAVYGESKTRSYKNTDEGFQHFWDENQKVLSNGYVVLETTGGYELALIVFLLGRDIALHRCDTRKAKHFIRSLGKLGKSDNIDALGLAQYGFERHEKLELYQSKPGDELQLLVLVQRRIDLKRMLVQEKNRLQSPMSKGIESSFEKIINVINEEVKNLDLLISKLITANEALSEKFTVLQSIPGVGQVTASMLVCLLPELGKSNRKQIASLAGLAPHPYESGQKIGYRKTRGGRQDIKPVVFMAAMSAIRGNNELANFYNHLISRGKKKMVALTAVMRKIIIIANARLKETSLAA